MIDSSQHNAYCSRCNDTKVVKYKKLDEFTFREWVPWLTKPCECTKESYNGNLSNIRHTFFAS